MTVFRAFGSSEQGPVRHSNEDCFGLDEPAGLCVVADGMGGHNGGEVASKLAVEGVTDFIRASGASPAWPFGSERSFGSPGSGGALGFADPDAGIGYAYVTSQMGTTLTGDPRDVALRNAVYAIIHRDRPVPNRTRDSHQYT